MAITTDEGIGILKPQQAILLIREILSRSDFFASNPENQRLIL